jgi:hypothetical protein
MPSWEDRARASREALRKQGLAPKNILDAMQRGAVFRCRDEALDLPNPEPNARNLHAFRPVIVAQSEYLRDRDPNTALVIPCSASARRPVGGWAYELPADERAFTKEAVVAYPHLLQPVLMSDLHEHLGDLSPTAWAEIETRIRLLLAFPAPVDAPLPPRD